jgi:hypothetical protein
MNMTDREAAFRAGLEAAAQWHELASAYSEKGSSPALSAHRFYATSLRAIPTPPEYTAPPDAVWIAVPREEATLFAESLKAGAAVAERMESEIEKKEQLSAAVAALREAARQLEEAGGE